MMNDSICRLCFQAESILFSIYKEQDGYSPYEKLVNILKIEISAAGPSSICSNCLVELNNSVNFYEKCQKSNQVLSARSSGKYEQFEAQNEPFDRGNIIETVNEVPRIVKKVDEDFIEASVLQVKDDPLVKAQLCPKCGSQRRCKHWTPPATHTCQFCSKVFTRKFNFTIHLKRHLGQHDWPCQTCGMPQVTAWLAQRHCQPRARRTCPMPGCGKTFTTNANLNTHIRSHNGEKPHICSECGKGFTCKSTLNNHLRIHTGVKPYICPVCGKRFATNKLAAHLRTHSDSRPHPCPATNCARAFRSARAARLHAATHSAAAARRSHGCGLCSARYNHKQSLNKHLRRHHQLGTQKPDSSTNMENQVESSI